MGYFMFTSLTSDLMTNNQTSRAETYTFTWKAQRNYCGHTATAVQKKFEIHCLRPSTYDVCGGRGGEDNDSAGELAECDSGRRGSKYPELVQTSHQHCPREKERDETAGNRYLSPPSPLFFRGCAFMCVSSTFAPSFLPPSSPPFFSFKVGQIHLQL